MRTWLRTAWLWLCLLVFQHRFYDGSADVAEPWKGATLGWSPKAAVSAVERTASWDVDGWYRDSRAELHRDLDRVEHDLRADLDDLLATVYAWRDSEVLV